MDLVGKYDSCGESSVEEISNKEKDESYRELLTEWKEYFLREETLKKTISTLLLEKQKQSSNTSDLKEENTWLNSKLDDITKFIHMLNNGFNMLYEIFQVRKMSRNVKGIGFEPMSVNKKDKTQPKKFVPSKNKSEFYMLDHMAKQPANNVYSYKGNNQNSNKRCHHYGRYEHIRSYCFRLYDYPQHYIQLRPKSKDKKAQKVWKPKVEVKSLIAQTYDGMTLISEWVLDSGCSKHMIGEQLFLE